MTRSARDKVAFTILLALGLAVGVVMYQMSYSDDRPVIIVSEGSVDINVKKGWLFGKAGQFQPTTDNKHWVHKYAPDPASIGSLTLKIQGANSACSIKETEKITGSIIFSYTLNGTTGTLTIFLSNGEVYLVSDPLDMVGQGSGSGAPITELVISGGAQGVSALTQVAFSLENGNGGSNPYTCTPATANSLEVRIKQHKK